MKKSRKKLAICVAVFIVIFCMIGGYVLQGFSIPSNSLKVTGGIFNAFYSEEENSLDGVYIGPSAVNRYWIPPIAFEEQGMAISVFSTPKQPFVLTKYMLQEAKKTQDPKLFIIDLICTSKDANYTSEETIRYTTDNLKPSLLRFRAAKAGLENMSLGENKVEGSKLAVYFPALESLKRKLSGDLKKDVHFNITNDVNPVKGYRLDVLTFNQKALPATAFDSEKYAPMAPETEALLLDLLDYCDSIDNEVIFVLSPFSAKEQEYPTINSAIEIVTSRGYDVVNFNTKEKTEEMGLDWENDFYNRVHVNCLGAEKYTSYFAKYLKENYDLGDHRDDKAYVDWHEAYENYVQLTTKGKKKMNTQ